MLQNEEAKINHRPIDTPLRQQRLPAWYPVYSNSSLIPVVFTLSVVFIPLGVIMLISSRNISEYVTDYTDCVSLESNTKCLDLRSDVNRMDEICTCQINITIDSFLTGNILFYYGLSNFFQNHKRYVTSRDDVQLNGGQSDLNACQPYHERNISNVVSKVAPCGSIANSIFNDTFSLISVATALYVPIKRTEIAWPTDKSTKFNNPFPANSTSLNNAFADYAMPIFWQKPVDQLDTSLASNNGYKNEALMVWMRTAAFSTFRKIYGRLDTDNTAYVNGFPPGTYNLTIDYNFPVKSYGGRKRFIVTTTSWLGQKNDFLGIAYLVFGSIFFFLGIFLTSLKSRMSYLKLSRISYSSDEDISL